MEFFANNLMGSHEIFVERTKYKNNINILNSIDFWNKNFLYGKIDFFGNAVSLSESNLKQLSNPNKTLFVVDFVADAFSFFQAEIKRKSRKKGFSFNDIKISSSIEPENAWLSVNEIYHSYMQSLYIWYTAIYLKNFRRESSISDFESFVKEFLFFLHNTKNVLPVTKSAFIKSNKCPNSVSGLTIELKKENFENDKLKQSIIEWKGFDSLRKTALKYGFVLNYNNPAQLIFNIISSKSHIFMNKYGIKTESGKPGDLFSTYYYKVSIQHDIEILKSYLEQYYNSFITAKPFFICNKKERNRKLFQNLNEEEWFKVYATIRFMESGKYFNIKEIEQKMLKILQIYKFIDIFSAIKVIEKEIEKK